VGLVVVTVAGVEEGEGTEVVEALGVREEDTVALGVEVVEVVVVVVGAVGVEEEEEVEDVVSTPPFLDGLTAS